MKPSWTKNDVVDRYENHTRDTASLWPANDIPRRCNITHHCTYFNKDRYPCYDCSSYIQNCSFRIGNHWRPIVYVWQLEYMLQQEIVQLREFLKERPILLEGKYISPIP